MEKSIAMFNLKYFYLLPQAVSLLKEFVNEIRPGISLIAAQVGVQVISQLETILWGPSIIKELLSIGVNFELLSLFNWVISLRRLASLCHKCKIPSQKANYDLEFIRQKFS